MHAPTLSSEFPRLTAAWLDGSATTEEIAQLREVIAEDPECARHFAYVARFDPLPDLTPEETPVPAEVFDLTTGDFVPAHPAHLAPGDHAYAHAAAETHRQRHAWHQSYLMHAAGLFVLAALGAAILWHLADATPTATPAAPTLANASSLPGTMTEAQRRALPAAPPFADVQATKPTVPEISLPERLDQFFLPSVDLDAVPLKQALGILQGQLQALNYLHTAALDKLNIIVPTAAASRPITFHSESIAFLKAVRAIAALAGCDVVAEDNTLTLVINREIYPQVTEQHNIRDLLAAPLRPDGSDPAADPQRRAGLLADLAALGILLNPNLPLDSQSLVNMTRGQWTALNMMTDARDQLGQLNLPNFELYVSDKPTSNTGLAYDADTAAALRRQFQADKNYPAATVLTKPVRADDTTEVDPASPSITAKPVGETTEITVTLPATDPDSDEATVAYQGTLQPGEGLSLPYTFTEDGNDGVSLSRDLTFLPIPTNTVTPGYILTDNGILHNFFAMTLKDALLQLTNSFVAQVNNNNAEPQPVYAPQGSSSSAVISTGYSGNFKANLHLNLGQNP